MTTIMTSCTGMRTSLTWSTTRSCPTKSSWSISLSMRKVITLRVIITITATITTWTTTLSRTCTAPILPTHQLYHTIGCSIIKRRSPILSRILMSSSSMPSRTMRTTLLLNPVLLPTHSSKTKPKNHSLCRIQTLGWTSNRA